MRVVAIKGMQPHSSSSSAHRFRISRLVTRPGLTHERTTLPTDAGASNERREVIDELHEKLGDGDASRGLANDIAPPQIRHEATHREPSSFPPEQSLAKRCATDTGDWCSAARAVSGLRSMFTLALVVLRFGTRARLKGHPPVSRDRAGALAQTLARGARPASLGLEPWPCERLDASGRADRPWTRPPVAIG